MSSKINVLLADDHQLFLDGLKLILKQNRQLNIVAEAASGGEALELLPNTAVDLIITDLGMPGMKGIDLVKHLKAQYPHIKLIVVTMHHEPEIISEIMYAEAEGYILKNSGKNTILQAVENVINGKTHYDEEVTKLFIENVKQEKKATAALKPLTARELEVLKLIIEEFTSKEIAEKLFISKQTVDTHRLNLMQKTGAHTTIGLIKYAIRTGLASV